MDQLIVGGGIANTFMLAAGLKIGKSLAEADLVDEAKAVIEAMKARGAAVPIPVDVVAAKTFAADAPATVKDARRRRRRRPDPRHRPEDRATSWPRSCAQAGTIVWNGPVGVFEFDAFAHGTEDHRPRHRRHRTAFRIAGGGDTLAAIAKYGIEDKSRLHLHRRRRLPRGAGRQDPAGVRDPAQARARRDASYATLRSCHAYLTCNVILGENPKLQYTRRLA